MTAFALPAVVDLASCSALAGQGARALATQTPPWRVDASPLERFDSSCLALLLQLRRQAPGQRLGVDGAPQRLRQLAAAYGVDFVFD